MTVFSCKTDSCFVSVKRKQNFKINKTCLWEIVVFGCNRERLFPKINVAGNFGLSSISSQI